MIARFTRADVSQAVDPAVYVNSAHVQSVRVADERKGWPTYIGLVSGGYHVTESLATVLTTLGWAS